MPYEVHFSIFAVRYRQGGEHTGKNMTVSRRSDPCTLQERGQRCAVWPVTEGTEVPRDECGPACPKPACNSQSCAV